MTTTITDYISVRTRLAELGCRLPSGVVFLPDNLAQADGAKDLLIRGEATTLTKVLEAGGVGVGQLKWPGTKVRFIHNKSHDWAMPALLFTAEALKDNPNLVSVAIDLVKDYVKELFKGLSGEKSIKVDIVVERTADGTFQKIAYEGDANGLETLANMIRDIHANG